MLIQLSGLQLIRGLHVINFQQLREEQVAEGGGFGGQDLPSILGMRLCWDSPRTSLQKEDFGEIWYHLSAVHLQN